jgi:hypoxanthine phosphoribosyltransferase
MNKIEKVYYGDVHVREMISDISMKMHRDNWKPDYIVGLTRGGLIPAVYLSHYLDVPMETLKVSLRDNAETETNCWMAEDAFGYDYSNEIIETYPASIYGEEGQGKNILIVDDINDTGATLDWIINDWQSSCMPDSPKWLNVWGNNVRIAVLVDNLSSNFSRKVDYCAKEINKAEKDVWIVYPWER